MQPAATAPAAAIAALERRLGHAVQRAPSEAERVAERVYLRDDGALARWRVGSKLVKVCPHGSVSGACTHVVPVARGKAVGALDLTDAGVRMALERHLGYALRPPPGDASQLIFGRFYANATDDRRFSRWRHSVSRAGVERAHHADSVAVACVGGHFHVAADTPADERRATLERFLGYAVVPLPPPRDRERVVYARHGRGGAFVTPVFTKCFNSVCVHGAVSRHCGEPLTDGTLCPGGGPACRHGLARDECEHRTCVAARDSIGKPRKHNLTAKSCRHLSNRAYCADPACPGAGGALCRHGYRKGRCGVSNEVCPGGRHGGICEHGLVRVFCSERRCGGVGRCATHGERLDRCTDVDCRAAWAALGGSPIDWAAAPVAAPRAPAPAGSPSLAWAGFGDLQAGLDALRANATARCRNYVPARERVGFVAACSARGVLPCVRGRCGLVKFVDSFSAAGRCELVCRRCTSNSKRAKRARHAGL